MTLRPEDGSDMSPFISAREIYRVLDIQNMTDPSDVLAIHQIAAEINAPDDWAGDPCLPAGYSSTGIVCSEDNPPRVIIIDLTNTGLKGSIPPSISELTALTELMLGNNSLSGSIPDLSSMKNLRKLYLQNNKLVGTIPEGLIKRTSDGSLDIRYEGNEGVGAAEKKPLKIKRWIIELLVGCSIFVIVVISITFLWRYKHRSQIETTDGPILPQPQLSYREAEDQNEYHRLAIEYGEEDIEVATKNYSNIIGKGAFGPVYYGKLSGCDVAVKILSTDSHQGQGEFQNEVTLLSRIYHRNLVKLIGYCRQPKVALVYEYMHLGTLKDHLYGIAKLEKPLDWRTRLKIASQAAQGLLYLHQGCNPPIIHRDIKSSNILLDQRMCAKLADFGLSKLLDKTQSYISTVVKGIPGYLDPEYFGTSLVTEKSDVYSFGVVVLEIISGTPPSEGIVESARKLLSCGRLEDLMDPSLNNQYSLQSAWKVAEIAYECIEPQSINRPKMSMVAKELEEAMARESENNDQSAHSSITSFHITDTDTPKVR